MVKHIMSDYNHANIDSKDKVMLHYAVILTTQACNVKEENIEILHEAGFSDEAILDIVQITAYYNFVNRLACGLGVELEK